MQEYLSSKLRSYTEQLSLEHSYLPKEDILEKIVTNQTRISEPFLCEYNIDNCKCPSCICGSSAISATLNLGAAISVAVATAPK